MTLSLALMLTLVVVILVLTSWLVATLQSKTEILTNQLEERNLALMRSEREISRLTTIIASRDPMTFQVLSTQQTTFSDSEETPYLTDEQEAEKWAMLTGKIDADGNDEDMADDLRMLGL